jgi:hypothetical protein
VYNRRGGVVGKAETTDVSVRSVPWWRWAFVGVVMFSLVTTLATRTFHVTISDSSRVESGESQAIRQHMDSDAAGWAAPVLRITVLLAPTFYPRVVPAGPPLRTLFIEENLYNRPPPTCGSLLFFFVKS